MDSESEFFSARELAEFGLAKYPETARGWLRLVERESWPFREVKSKGRGGIRREYQPPEHVLELIHARLRGDISAPEPLAQPNKLVNESPTADDYIDIVAPRIAGAAGKCPSCGGFLGLIKIEGRVLLEFDSPGGLTFAQVLVTVAPDLLKTDRDAAINLALRAYSILSLLTAGDEEAIARYLDNPKLVDALSSLSQELNATPPHIHDMPKNPAIAW